jgi:hypothetical protein
VYFIGVWDTVGALGVPEYFGLLNALQNVLGFLDKTSVLDWFSKVSPLAALPLPMYFGFHDVRLNPRVKHARHALALDEQRAPFTPTLWDEANSERVQQVWFPGSHMDVGGGYAQAGLSDGALLWMINEARRAQPEALRFIDALVLEIEANANPRDVLHDDNRDAFAAVPPVYAVIKPVLDYLFEPRPRAVPPIDETSRVTDGDPRRSVHQSAYDRQKAPFVGSGFYRTHRVLENHAGGTAVEVNAPVAVDACEDWNSTGLYLETGRYSFTAKGQWSNLERWSGPNGEADLSRSEAVALLRHHPVKALQRACAAVAGRFKSIVVWATKNPNSNVVLCRREEREPWMSLVGVVANGGIEPDGKYRKHQIFGIGGKKECTVWQPGYLYAFANDAPGLYNDNFGTVELQVERLQ